MTERGNGGESEGKAGGKKWQQIYFLLSSYMTFLKETLVYFIHWVNNLKTTKCPVNNKLDRIKVLYIKK